MREVYYIKNEDWQIFLSKLLEKYKLYAPKEGLNEPEYSILEKDNLSKIIYAKARLTLALKFFIYPPQEKVSPDEPLSDPSFDKEGKKNIILGVKACDLKALAVLDKIFLDPDFPDPFYKTRRQHTMLISDDCTEMSSSCFCILLGGNPFPQEGFDLNLSPLPPLSEVEGDDGVLIEVGSAEGKALLEEYKPPVHTPGEDRLKIQKEKRQELIKRLEEINKDFKFPKAFSTLIEGKYDSPLWTEVSEDCVGCCACTNICPACHCFFLSELSTTPLFSKLRYWDSCQYTSFARVAGGANPRSKLMERFRNRFYCKLEYKPKNFELLGCSGCGRCIEACQGKIDIREVLTKVMALHGIYSG